VDKVDKLQFLLNEDVQLQSRFQGYVRLGNHDSSISNDMRPYVIPTLRLVIFPQFNGTFSGECRSCGHLFESMVFKNVSSHLKSHNIKLGQILKQLPLLRPLISKEPVAASLSHFNLAPGERAPVVLQISGFPDLDLAAPPVQSDSCVMCSICRAMLVNEKTYKQHESTSGCSGFVSPNPDERFVKVPGDQVCLREGTLVLYSCCTLDLRILTNVSL